MKAIVPPIPKTILTKEINSLSEKARYIERGKFQVYIAPSNSIPNILKEIGRLRESTFRAVGEGTGKALDLDEFDDYYYQLFIWDKEDYQIIGGYRIGLGKTIFTQYGEHKKPWGI